MNKRKTIVIIDGNNLAYGIYSRFKEGKSGLLSSTTGIPTTVIFGMLRSLETFVKHTEVDRAIVCWDVGGGSKWRKSIFPQYKAGRKYGGMEDYFAELESAREYLALFGINQGPCQGIEADDVIGWLTKKYESEGWKVIIYSNDKDYYQLVTKHVSIWRTAVERFVGVKEVVQAHGIPPNRIHLLDGLLGQQKDNIPGACDLDENGVMKKFGFGEAKALKLLCHPDNEDMTLRNVLRILRSEKPPVSEKFVAQLLRNWKQVTISAKLSRIRTKDRHYEGWEIEKLQEVYSQSIKLEEIDSKNIFKVSSMLDIRMIDIATICKKIGVNVKGKTRKKVIVKVA